MTDLDGVNCRECGNPFFTINHTQTVCGDCWKRTFESLEPEGDPDWASTVSLMAERGL